MGNFGLDQIGKDTPTIVKRLRDALLFIVAGSLVAVNVVAPALHMTVDAYGQWSGFALIVIKGISMMFGVPVEENNK